MSANAECGFDVRAVAFEQLPQDGCLVVALAEEPNGGGQALLFQRTLREDPAVDAQDVLLGMDTYCVSNEFGASVYGGVAGWRINNRVLTLSFGQDAARVLGLRRECRFRLVVDDQSIARLAEGLAQILGGFSGAPASPLR